jgi:hypothetical protein
MDDVGLMHDMSESVSVWEICNGWKGHIMRIFT